MSDHNFFKTIGQCRAAHVRRGEQSDALLIKISDSADIANILKTVSIKIFHDKEQCLESEVASLISPDESEREALLLEESFDADRNRMIKIPLPFALPNGSHQWTNKITLFFSGYDNKRRLEKKLRIMELPT